MPQGPGGGPAHRVAVSISTRTGDDGSTRLLYGQRVPKHHPQVEAVGAFDELNVAIGAARPPLAPGSPRRALLESAQRALVALMGELACAEADQARYLASDFPKLAEADLALLDAAVAELEGRGLRFDGWATPGANAPSAAFEQARVAARRAERRLCALPEAGRSVRPLLLRYANRLSDVLWLLAREAEANDRTTA